MRNLRNLTLVGALIAGSGLGAQENVGTVMGTVRDASGVPVSGVLVRVSGPNLLVPREATSDANGRYSFRLILPGQVRVQFSKQGFIGGYQSITVTSGSTQTVNFAMRAMGVATEEIEITANADNPIIDKTETKVTSTYTIQDLFNLPIGGSGVYAALYLAPGMSGDTHYVRVRGGTSGQALYSLNGIQMRDPMDGEGRQYEFIIDDLIQDVQVVQNPINAKYGFTSSGSVNITTKTGTNRFEGSFRVAMSNGAWGSLNGSPRRNRWSERESNVASAADDWYYEPPLVPADEMRRVYSATIMGPIWKDKITFSYGGRFQPQNYKTLTYTSLLGASSTSWRTHLPGLSQLEPRYTGPNLLDPTQPDGIQWAGYFWGYNPAAPTEPVLGYGPESETFNQYKLFFQITPDHQVDVLYSRNTYDAYGSGSATLSPDRTLQYWYKEVADLSGFSYRGILGPNAVLSVQWGRRKAVGTSPKGPDDPISIVPYSSGTPAIIMAVAVPSFSTGGNSGGDTLQESKNWSVDLNYIWNSHNIDTGVQRINESTFSGGVGINNRSFSSPGRRYDGTYLVHNPFHPDSYLQRLNGTGEVDATGRPISGGTMTNYATVVAWQLAILRGNRVPYYATYSSSANGSAPHDAQVTSLYANDNWTYSDNIAISFGLRADQTIVTNYAGEIVNSLGVNPRFRAQYDLFGDNRHVFSLSLTQQVGNLHRAAMGSFSADSKSSVSRRFTWNKDNPNGTAQAFFVTPTEFKNTDNYGYYWSYSDSIKYMMVDKDLKPEKTTNTELMYRRAFDDGGYFRASLIYGFMNRALFAEERDIAVTMEDPNPPNGRQPDQPVAADSHVRYLYNRGDRYRHYASAEMEWSIPLISSPTWKLKWAGNWTIAKTTGNLIFESSGQGGSTEGSVYRFYEKLMAIGMTRELVDPWGESDVTHKHRMRTWVTLSHGDRGGVLNELTLFANWTSALLWDEMWTYTLPNNTFSNAYLNGGTVQDFPPTVQVWPHGIGYRKPAGDTYSAHLTWNITIPIAGKMSAFINVMIGNVFNSIIDAQGATGWENGNNSGNKIWVYGQKPGDNDDTYGLKVAGRLSGPYWGVYGSAGGARSFNSKLEFGFRF